jgi:hypothetical protein
MECSESLKRNRRYFTYSLVQSTGPASRACEKVFVLFRHPPKDAFALLKIKKVLWSITQNQDIIFFSFLHHRHFLLVDEINITTLWIYIRATQNSKRSWRPTSKAGRGISVRSLMEWPMDENLRVWTVLAGQGFIICCGILVFSWTVQIIQMLKDSNELIDNNWSTRCERVIHDEGTNERLPWQEQLRVWFVGHNNMMNLLCCSSWRGEKHLWIHYPNSQLTISLPPWHHLINQRNLRPMEQT